MRGGTSNYNRLKSCRFSAGDEPLTFSSNQETEETVQHFSKQANMDFLLGACLAGKCLREVSMSIQHKAVHVLGGRFGLEHAAAHAVLLPYVLHLFWTDLPELVRDDFFTVLGSDPASSLACLSHHAGAPDSLRELGLRLKDLPEAARSIVSEPYAQVVPVCVSGMQNMLQQAWAGNVSVLQT